MRRLCIDSFDKCGYQDLTEQSLASNLFITKDSSSHPYLNQALPKQRSIPRQNASLDRDDNFKVTFGQNMTGKQSSISKRPDRESSANDRYSILTFHEIPSSASKMK